MNISRPDMGLVNDAGFPGGECPPHRERFGWKAPRRPPGPNPVPGAGTPATSPVTNRHQKGSSSEGYFHIKCLPPVPSHLGERALHKGRGKINIIFQKRNGRFPLPKHFRAIFFFLFFFSHKARIIPSPEERGEEKHIRGSYGCLKERSVRRETRPAPAPWGCSRPRRGAMLLGSRHRDVSVLGKGPGVLCYNQRPAISSPAHPTGEKSFPRGYCCFGGGIC